MASNKGKIPARHNQDTGPSWRDVHIIWAELESLTGQTVKVQFTLDKGLYGQMGLHCMCRVGDTKVYSFGAGFGSAFPDSYRTMPSTIFALLTKVYYWWEGQSAEQLGLVLSRWEEWERTERDKFPGGKS